MVEIIFNYFSFKVYFRFVYYFVIINFLDYSLIFLQDAYLITINVFLSNLLDDNKININKNCKFQLDKSLKNTRNDFSFEIPSYNQMIKEMYDWIVKHQNLYPNYKLY